MNILPELKFFVPNATGKYWKKTDCVAKTDKFIWHDK